MSESAIIRQGSVISLYHANGFFSRARGLLCRSLGNDEGMLIEPCTAVHTIGMRFEIDVVFIDCTNRIVKIVSCLKPWRISACRGAHKVLELRAGRARELNFSIGETVFLSLPIRDSD